MTFNFSGNHCTKIPSQPTAVPVRVKLCPSPVLLTNSLQVFRVKCGHTVKVIRRTCNLSRVYPISTSACWDSGWMDFKVNTLQATPWGSDPVEQQAHLQRSEAEYNLSAVLWLETICTVKFSSVRSPTHFCSKIPASFNYVRRRRRGGAVKRSFDSCNEESDFTGERKVSWMWWGQQLRAQMSVCGFEGTLFFFYLCRHFLV